MAYKFQLGKMTTQEVSSGAGANIKLLDGDFTAADGSTTGEITAVDLDAATLTAGTNLVLEHASKGLIITGASATTDAVHVKGTQDAGEELITMHAQSVNRAQMFVRRRDAANDGQEVIELGASDGTNDVATADDGFVLLRNSGSAITISLEATNGDAVLTSMSVQNTTNAKTINVGGNFTATGNFVQTGANSKLIEVDTTNKVINGDSLTVNDEYDGSSFNSGETKGGFSVHGAAKVLLKKATLASQANTKHIAFTADDGSTLLSLEAASFVGDGQHLTAVDPNGSAYSSTLNTISGNSGTLVKSQLNVIHGNPSGVCTLTLPKADTLSNGDVIKVLNFRHDASSSNKLTIQRSADNTDSIDGVNSFDVSSGEAVVSIVVIDNAGSGKFMLM